VADFFAEQPALEHLRQARHGRQPVGRARDAAAEEVGPHVLPHRAPAVFFAQRESTPDGARPRVLVICEAEARAHVAQTEEADVVRAELDEPFGEVPFLQAPGARVEWGGRFLGGFVVDLEREVERFVLGCVGRVPGLLGGDVVGVCVGWEVEEEAVLRVLGA